MKKKTKKGDKNVKTLRPNNSCQSSKKLLSKLLALLGKKRVLSLTTNKKIFLRETHFPRLYIHTKEKEWAFSPLHCFPVGETLMWYFLDARLWQPWLGTEAKWRFLKRAGEKKWVDFCIGVNGFLASKMHWFFFSSATKAWFNFYHKCIFQAIMQYLIWTTLL